MADSNLYLYVSAYADNPPEDPHDHIFNIFQSIIPESSFVTPVQITREPYETPLVEIKVACDQASSNASEEASVRLRQYIVDKIGEKRKTEKKECEKVFVTFIEDEKFDYHSLCELQLEDFSLGSFQLVTLMFHQFFTHSASFRSAAKSLRLSIAFDLRKLFVSFAISWLPLSADDVSSPGNSPEEAPVKTTTEVYQLRLHFSNIEKNIYIHEQKEMADVYILLLAPLELWRTKDCLKRVEAVNHDVKWNKTVKLKSEVKSLQQINLSELLGDSRVLKLTLDRRTAAYEGLIRSFEMNEFLLNYTFVTKKVARNNNLPKRLVNGDFECDWYLQALHSLGYHTRLQFTDDFKDFVFKNRKDPNLMQALERAYITIMKSQHSPLLRTVQFYFQNPRKMGEFTPRYNCYIRRVIVTPTRKVYLPQSLMHENRILREFEREYAISVTFRNDDYTKLNDQFSSQEFTRETVYDTLTDGIRISTRHYQFLGCSNSQQKNHACWFYAKDTNGVDSTSILSWVGNLDGERLPGKYISRVGQCFSKTKPVELSEVPELVLRLAEPDICGGEKNYCFTDGIGRISKDMLHEVFRHLDEPYIPSAFQIRLGGCKGMLALDPTLEGKQILIRDSMNKFDSQHRKLEVMRVAVPIRLYLNRQIITLLANHRGDFGRLASVKNKKHSGILGGDREFSYLLLNMLYDLADSLLDERQAAASLGSRSRFPCPFNDLVHAGFSLLQDPFFRDMCLAAAKERNETVRRKFNVELPPEEARNMFGVVDETGRLEYGQVFIRYSANVQKPGENPKFVEGPVLVSKMPCLHPGDVRVLNAVYVKDLCHHVDCIVFPQKGRRPHPDEMSGSDLDGDEYFVTWRRELLLDFPNCTAMDYSPSPAPAQAPRQPQQPHRPITKEDMIDYLVDFINSDQIGPVASYHVVWADQDGIYSKKCLGLCQLHSDVIDSNKTGQVLDGRSKSFRPYKYPDFMDKMDHKDTYRSKGVLGRFFRIARRVHVILSEELSQDLVLDERLIIAGHEDYLEQARELRTCYEDSLAHIQHEYGVEKEVELVSGCSLKMDSPLALSENDDYNTKKLVQGKCDSLFQQTRSKFYQDLGMKLDRITESVLFKASACYRLTYTEPSKYRSFPWVFGDILTRVLRHWFASKRAKIPPIPVNPQYARLEDSIGSIPESDIDDYLRRRGVRVVGCQDKATYYVLLRWFDWCRIHTLMSRKYFVDLIEAAIDSGEDGVLGALKYLGLQFDGNNSEAFTREVAIARFRLALYCDWRKLEFAGNTTRRISQSIIIYKYKWLKIRDLTGAFLTHFERAFADCSFKLRQFGFNGLFHVIGPAMNVYEVMETFNDQFDKFVNRRR